MGAAPRVLLVDMPWGSARMGSLQLALLAAAAQRDGASCDSAYFNLELARRIGLNLYETIASQQLLIGEILFAPFVFPEVNAAAALEALEAYAERRWGPPGDEPTLTAAVPWGRSRERALIRAVRDALPRLQAEIAALLDEAASGRDWSGVDLVGFSTTFEQNLPSLALASRIKQRAPHVRIAFGGANCDGEMGPALHAAFPHLIDHVVVGEGDESFPELLRALRDGADPGSVRGVTSRAEGGEVRYSGGREPLRDLDATAVPDYRGYLDALAQSGLSLQPRLPFESSRGCWWGERHLCTFCGLNQSGLLYRAKSASRIVGEVVELAERHGRVEFNAVDNILHVRWFQDVLPAFAGLRRKHDLDFFYEVKANLKKEQVAMLRDAGVMAVQPGIESFSDRILAGMDKGATGILNAQTLKWLHEYGIQAIWGILLQAPGETVEDCELVLSWIPFLEHLPPPGYVIPVELHRFSPYFRDPASFGLRARGPAEPYALAYRLDGALLARIAYVYDYDRDHSPPLDAARKRLSRACERWYQSFAAGAERGARALVYERGPRFLSIHDARSGTPRTHRLRGAEARAYELCDQYQSWRAVEAHLGAGAERTVQALIAERLVLRDPSGRVLSLATAAEPPARRPTRNRLTVQRPTATIRR